MSKIKIKVIEPETVEVFGPDGSSYGKLNELEFLDLRCQIKKNKQRGFYIYYKGDKIGIRKDGLMERYVPIFVDSIYKYNYLLGIPNEAFKDNTLNKIYNNG
jgi:hypothetical protein